MLRRPRLCATAEHAVAEPAAEALAGPVVSSAPAPMPDAQPAAPSPPPTLVPVLPAAPERRLSLSLVSAPSPLATLSLASGDLEGLVGAAALPAALLLLFAASAALGYGAGTQAGGPAGPARAVLSAPPVRSAASVDDDPALLRARAEAAESALSEVSSRLRELRAALRQTDSERASFAEQAAEANDQLELLTEEGARCLRPP